MESEKVRDAVLEHYLETGTSATAVDQAERLGCSVSVVHKAHRDSLGNVKGTIIAHSCDRKTRWLPERFCLREIILRLRREAGVK